jgi:(1->4)-alpha-D-glucan 1-alpha-D-glucosylmutase
VQRIARLGINNSLAQLVLKLTAPGIPDIYQGNEGWNLSMVDPDNRRPVNYTQLTQQLDELDQAAEHSSANHKALEQYLACWQDGRIKLHVTHALLQFRSANAELFARGSYRALQVLGDYADEVCAFMRELDDCSVIVVVTRFPARREQRGNWGDTHVVIPASYANVSLLEIISGRQVTSDNAPHLEQLLGKMSVAVLSK